MSELAMVTVPQMNPNDETAVLVRWHVVAGTRVAQDQAIVTLETTKAAFDVHAPSEGYVFFDHEPHSIVAVGSTIAWISEQPNKPERLPVTETNTERPSQEGGISRKALRLMKLHGLNASDFIGIERIMTEDVERVARERMVKRDQPAPENAEPLDQSPAKIIEAQALAEVYSHAIPSTVSISLSVAKTDARLANLAAQHGPISLLEAAIHGMAQLLGEFPELNGFHAGGRAWHAKDIAIGFAINIGRSLRVPVVRRADQLSQLDIARAVRELSLKYMRDELDMADLTGGTITVTDLSGYEVTHFVPVLNQRQSAILGICAERPDSGYRELVLSFDHRMSDGMQAAKFLSVLRGLLEDAPTE